MYLLIVSYTLGENTLCFEARAFLTSTTNVLVRNKKKKMGLKKHVLSGPVVHGETSLCAFPDDRKLPVPEHMGTARLRSKQQLSSHGLLSWRKLCAHECQLANIPRRRLCDEGKSHICIGGLSAG